MVFQWIELNLT